MTKDEIIKSKYDFYDPINSAKYPSRDIMINSKEAKELMEAYWIDQLKGLIEDLRQVHPEYIIERIKNEISSLEHGI